MANENLISSVWGQRDLGVELSADKIGAVSNSDVDYICDKNYPFIQIVKTDAAFEESVPTKFIKTSNGWTIHDYGEAISVSSNYMVNAEGQVSESGNISNQIIIAEEIAKLVTKKGWKSVELIDGTPTLKNFVWMQAKRYGFDLNGYEPSKADEARYNLLVQNKKMDVPVSEKMVSVKEDKDLKDAVTK